MSNYIGYIITITTDHGDFCITLPNLTNVGPATLHYHNTTHGVVTIQSINTHIPTTFSTHTSVEPHDVRGQEHRDVFEKELLFREVCQRQGVPFSSQMFQKYLDTCSTIIIPNSNRYKKITHFVQNNKQFISQ